MNRKQLMIGMAIGVVIVLVAVAAWWSLSVMPSAYAVLTNVYATRNAGGFSTP